MKHLFTLIFLFQCVLAFSQENFPYTLTSSNQDYVELENDTLLVDQFWNNDEFTITFPYDFNFMGYSLVSLEQVGFGAGFLASSFNGTDLNFFVPYGIDILDGSLVPDADSSSVSFRLYGDEEDFEVFVVQFSNVAFTTETEEEATAENRVSFQLRFYQETNVFEIHFGPANITNEDLVFGDLDGPPIFFTSDITISGEGDEGGEGNYVYDTSYYLTGDPDNPELSSYSGMIFNMNQDSVFMETAGLQYLSGHPSEGTVYTFTPVSTSVDQLDQPKFRIYPSPAESILNIESYSSSQQRLAIYNAVGQLVEEEYIQPKTRLKQLNVQGLVPGIYIIQIGDRTSKFIKK